MNIRARLPALLATFLFPLICMAQTQSGQPQVETPLLNSVTTTITGTLVPATTVQTGATTKAVVPASCQFSLALAPGQKSVEARRVSDIAMDAANNTCNAQFEVGEPQTVASLSDAERANLANTTVNSSSGVPAQTGSTLTAQPDLALATIQSAGFLKTWWIDPISITVNSVQNSTTWRWSGAGHCVTGILGGQTLTWFSPSGWSLVSDSWQNTFNCSATTSASTVLYRNGIFCAFFTTWASYNPNKVQGLQNGTLFGTWNDSVFGTVCVNLLRFRMQLTRTQN
ncbi:MAG TPA: hypothetical protein VN872_05610 [Candidatus Acidoferrum sp.]|nr:hypothetical protein [Candidatus Acidoferrum sp.]